MRIPLGYTVTAFFLLFPASALAAPEIAIEHPHYNFGTIVQGTKVNHTFTLKNAGDTPLLIKQVKPSCGCTAATVSSTTIAPGGKGEIRASFDSKNFYGSVNKGIAVESNDPKMPVSNLSLKGTIIEELEVNPKQLNFGRVKTETSKGLDFTIDNKGKKPVKITGARVSIPQSTVKVAKYTIGPGETTTVTVTVTPRKSDRVISGYVSLTTDYPAKPVISVPFYGSLER